MNLNSILYNLRKILKYFLFILIIILLIGIFFILTSDSVHALTFEYNNTTYELADFTEASRYYIGYDNGSYFLWAIRDDSPDSYFFYLNGQYVWIAGWCYLYNYVNGQWVYANASAYNNSMGLPAHVIYSTVDIYSDGQKTSVWWHSNTSTPDPNPNNEYMQFTYDYYTYRLPAFSLSTKFFVGDTGDNNCYLVAIDSDDSNTFFFAPYDSQDVYVSGTARRYHADNINNTWIYDYTISDGTRAGYYNQVRFSTVNIYNDIQKTSIRWSAQAQYSGLYPYFRDYEDPDGVQNTLVTGETTSYFGFYVPTKTPQEGDDWYTSKYTSYVKIVDTSSGATLEDLPNNQNVTFIDLNEWFTYPYGDPPGPVRKIFFYV